MKPWRQAAEAQGPECRSVTSEDYVADPSLVNQFVNAHARGLVHETTTTPCPADMIIGTLGLVPTGIYVTQAGLGTRLRFVQAHALCLRQYTGLKHMHHNHTGIHTYCKKLLNHVTVNLLDVHESSGCMLL